MSHRFPAFRFVLGFLCLGALAALPLAAQAPPPSRLLTLTVVTLKPGMARAYVDFQKSEAIPALQKGGQTWRESWRTAVFGDPSEVAHVSEIKGFDQFDSPSPIRKALGDAGYAAYLAKASTFVTGQRTYAIRTRPDLSYVASPGARPKMAILTTVDVKADRLVEFEAFIKGDWIAALKKGGGKHYEVSQVVYGGNTTEYMTLVGVDSFAELGMGHPVTKALGEEGLVKLMARSGGFAQKIDRRVIRLDTDLSFEVKATASAR
jgi:hypothetical protein